MSTFLSFFQIYSFDSFQSIVLTKFEKYFFSLVQIEIGSVPTKDMQVSVDANLFRLGSTNLQKNILNKIFKWYKPTFFSKVLKFRWKMQNRLNQNNNQIFHFYSYGHFCSFLYSNPPNFRWIFTMSQKIKIGKIIFHSFQSILHLSWNWEGGGFAYP